MRKLFCLALLALLPFKAHATPTRALTLDNQQELVPDDYDATVYYSLAPNFKNHLYIDAYNNSEARGWTFLDIKFGTLVLWWNREYAPSSLFDLVGSQYQLGYSLGDLSTGTLGAPSEGLVKAPDMKVAIGYGLDTSITGLNLGLCFQYAELNQSLNSATTDGSGAPFLLPLQSSARYLNGSYYSDLTVTGYANRQYSSGMTLAPLLSYSGENFALDLKGELIWNRLNNSHVESDADNGGDLGTVTQGLKDTGALSKGGRARLRVPVADGSLVLKGSYYDYDFSTQHTELGTFSGAGFNAAQLGGFDHSDAQSTLTQKAWDAMLGWVHGFSGGRDTLVIGLGASGSTTHALDVQESPRTVGGNYNDLVTTLRYDDVQESLTVPVLIGAEAELAHGVKARGVLQRNLYGRSSQTSTQQAFDSSSGLLTRQDAGGGDSDLDSQWTFATGLGFDLGSLQWDIAVNTAFLASSGGWVNPAYQSTLSWGF